MLDEHDGQAQVGDQPAQQLHEGARLALGHARRGLVEEEQRGLGGEGPRDLQAPLVAVGETAGHVVGVVGEPDAVEQRRARAPTARPPRGGSAGRARARPTDPSRMRACMPTRTFSMAVMLPKSRMFWNVRHTPERR